MWFIYDSRIYAQILIILEKQRYSKNVFKIAYINHHFIIMYNSKIFQIKNNYKRIKAYWLCLDTLNINEESMLI